MGETETERQRWHLEGWESSVRVPLGFEIGLGFERGSGNENENENES
jgi:hypothetical protein